MHIHLKKASLLSFFPQMNTCILHSSGALLIDISSVSMLEKSFALRPASTPSGKQGNYEVINYLFTHGRNVPKYILTSSSCHNFIHRMTD